MKATVTEIQVGGAHNCNNLEDACEEYLDMAKSQNLLFRPKIHFTIKLPNGKEKSITIRDEEGQTIAYGNFEGLPSFLDYAREVLGEGN